jgi:hypothetical protein
MNKPTALPDFDDLHHAVRDVYRETMRRRDDTGIAFDDAVATARSRLPLPDGELRRIVARFLAEEPASGLRARTPTEIRPAHRGDAANVARLGGRDDRRPAGSSLADAITPSSSAKATRAASRAAR